MKLWVKGNILDAIMAARARGIVLTDFQEQTDYNTTVAEISLPETTPVYQEKVARWFGELATPEDGKGFPVGTLLYFSEHA